MILDVQPGHDEARSLLAEIKGRTAVAHSETVEDAVEAVTSATSGELTGRFRDALGADGPVAKVRLLTAWLQRIQRNRGARHAG